MADKTKIEWTDATWNPIRGCSVVSEGCRNCYAMAVAARFSGAGQAYEGLAYRNESGAHWTGKVKLVEEHLKDPLRWKKPRRIFVNSMSDLCHESIPDEWIDQIFAVMALSPQHQFQVLTKRPERMRDYLLMVQNDDRDMQRWANAACDITNSPCACLNVKEADWPLPYVWLGISCEDQKTADKRIPVLMETPAAVRWISAEPLLGDISARTWHCACGWQGSESTLRPSPSSSLVCPQCGASGGLLYRNWLDSDDGRRPALDWVVVGGESGPGARPMHPDWARNLRDQSVAAGVPFFFKQWGEWLNSGECDDPCGRCVMALRSWNGTELTGTDWEAGHHLVGAMQLHPVGKKNAGRLLDGKEWNQYP